MRRLLLASCLSGAVALGGCSTLTTLSQNGVPTIAEVQADAVQACGFLPTAETVAGLLTQTNAAASAGLVLGSTIAAIICGSVTGTAVKAARAALPIADGVVIRGKFVR